MGASGASGIRRIDHSGGRAESASPGRLRIAKAGPMAIPARAHFCWLGASLPWAYVFAVLSASEKSGLAEIVLHHTDALEDGARLRALARCPRVRLRRLDPIACLRQAGRALGAGDRLAAIYRAVDRPAIRTDVLRAAILYLHGGVYLDLDTITTASLLPLLEARQFVGCELTVWPHSVRTSRSPAVWCRALALDVLRKALRRAPRGWQMFRRVQGLYHRGINNAVMGAEAGSRLCARYLLAMVEMPLERCSELYALGPDLLQDVVDRLCGEDVTIAEPDVFYPLPPEISAHWFRVARGRPGGGAAVSLEAVLSARTRVVHWYASVRTRSKVAAIDPQFVREHRERQLYSALVCSCISKNALEEML
jgi:hypothetical protein